MKIFTSEKLFTSEKRKRICRRFRPVIFTAKQFPVNIDVDPGIDPSIEYRKEKSAHEPAEKRSLRRFFREAWLLPVQFYRRCISPLFPPVCRYTPTCSAYCMEAVRRWGILRGTALAVWRILRCNPLGGKGYDPVPIPKPKRDRDGKRKKEDTQKE